MKKRIIQISFVSFLLLIINGCSFMTQFKILNLSSKNIKIKYELYHTSKSVIFEIPKKGDENVFELIKHKKDCRVNYSSGRSTFNINKNKRIEVELKPNEVLILGSVHGPIRKDKKTDYYQEFNINYLEIENGKDSIKLVNNFVESMFTEIDKNIYGIKVE